MLTNLEITGILYLEGFDKVLQNADSGKEKKQMKSTGIVRSIDNMGRLVLPIELRKTLHLGEKEAVEIFTEGNDIILRKFSPRCTFCHSTENLIPYRGQNVCKECVRKLELLSE